MFAVCVIALLYSCKDDPLTLPANNPHIQIIDSNIFNWRFIPVTIKNFFDYYIIDTNNIYYVGDEKVFHYNGSSSVIIHNSSQRATNIAGTSSNIVFIGGWQRDNNSIYYPWLKKWNGITTSEIPLPKDSNYTIVKIYVRAPEDVWISCHSGRIYHYIQDTVLTYQLNTTNINVPAFFVFGNELFYYFYYPTSNTRIHKIYKFTENEWVEYITDETSDISLQYRTSPFFVNDSLLRVRTERIELFNGSIWQVLTETPSFEPYSIAGPSTNKFLSSGFISIFRNMYFYDGEKWLYQSALPLPNYDFATFPVDIAFANNTYFGFYYAVTSVPHNYILVGNLKEK